MADYAEKRRLRSESKEESVFPERKRAKIDETDNAADTAQSSRKGSETQALLLTVNVMSIKDIPRECMQRVMGFLNLREGLWLRGTCRHFRFRQTETGEQSDSLDIFRYCFLYKPVNTYTQYQLRILERAGQDVDTLEQILANESCGSEKDWHGFYGQIYPLKRALIKANNTEALLALSNSGKMELDDGMLIDAWKQGGEEIASLIHSLLLKEEKQRPGTFEMCATCETNVGIFECIQEHECNKVTEEGWAPLYCRSCILKTASCCRVCYDLVCPDCDPSNDLFMRCYACKKMICCRCCTRCQVCDLTECVDCANESEWSTRLYRNRECRMCKFCIADERN